MIGAAVGDRVIVYRNLNRGGWSIAAPKGARGRGLVIGHAEAVLLTGCRYVVSEASRQAVIRTGHRSVHAWLIGTLAAPLGAEGRPEGREVTYNPHRAGNFQYRDNGRAAEDGAAIYFAPDGRAYEIGRKIG